MNNEKDKNKINAGRRILTMLLDHAIMTTIAMIFYIPYMISNMAESFKVTHEQTNPSSTTGALFYISLLGFAIYFCKDCFNGRSFAKRILRLQIVDNSSGKVASPLKCFIRNILIVLWPIEAIVALTNTSRRLGDRIAGTKLVVFVKPNEKTKINIVKIAIPFLLSYGLIILLMLPFKGVMSAMEGSKVNCVESSFNQQSSKELEQLLIDSLGVYFVPSIKIFDSIQNDNLKYISTILQLKENYLEDEDDYKRLNNFTLNLIYSKFPKESFTGKVKYIYQAPGQMQSVSICIGADYKPKHKK